MACCMLDTSQLLRVLLIFELRSGDHAGTSLIREIRILSSRLL